VLELLLEGATEFCERGPREVQPLEDERGACLELGEDAADVGRPVEGCGPPRDAGRVRAELELRPCLDEAEAGVAKAARADEPLDVRDGEEVVETAALRARNDERLLLPVLGEELLGGDRVDRAL
jgi:hypothetical protein